MSSADLNPIFAKIASSVENSEYTSVFEHIHDKTHHDAEPISVTNRALVKFVGTDH